METTFADGHPVPTNRDSEELVQECCRECGINEDVAMDVLSFYEERIPVNGSFLRDYASKFEVYEDDSLAVLVGYIRRQPDDPRMLRMAFEVFLLAKGKLHLASARSFTELAKLYGLQKVFGSNGKATVQKAFDHFRRRLKQPPMQNQRDDTARERMSYARHKQTNHARTT